MVGARPKLETLYDVFVNVRSKSAVIGRGFVDLLLTTYYYLLLLTPILPQVRNDEREHWKTLCNLVQFDDTQACSHS